MFFHIQGNISLQFLVLDIQQNQEEVDHCHWILHTQHNFQH